jgi:hypothetical protein
MNRSHSSPASSITDYHTDDDFAKNLDVSNAIQPLARSSQPDKPAETQLSRPHCHYDLASQSTLSGTDIRTRDQDLTYLPYIRVENSEPSRRERDRSMVQRLSSERPSKKLL